MDASTDAPTDPPPRAGAYVATLVVVAYVAARAGLDRDAQAAFAIAAGVSLLAVAVSALDELVVRLPRRLVETPGLRGLALLVSPVYLTGWAASRLAFAHPPWMIGLVCATAVATTAIGVAAALATRRSAPPPRYWASALVVQLALIGLFAWMHEREATLRAVRAGTASLHVELFAATTLGTALAWPAVALRSDAGAVAASRRARAALALGALGAGLALLEADRRLFVGLYDAVHVWLAVLGWAMTDAGARLAAPLVAPRSRRALHVAGLSSAAAVAACAAALWLGRDRLGRADVRARLDDRPFGWIVLGLVAPRGFAVAPTQATQRALALPTFHDEPAPRGPRPNLLLVSVDALRADQIGPLESPNPLAPRLAALAGQSVRFRRAYCPGPRTTLSMTALHLGLYTAHVDWKLRRYHEGKLLDDDGDDSRFVHTTVADLAHSETLAVRLGRAGFHTVAATFAGKNRFFARGEGFETGFAEYRDLGERPLEAPSSAAVTRAADELLSTAKSPWFLWLHYYDPHESKRSRARYRALVNAFDDALGGLVDGLVARGEWDRTAVVVVADHGEAFGEHGQFSHASSLYDEQALVPFLLRVPGVAARDEARPVSTIDATATLLALGGASLEGVDGVNLVPLLQRGAYPTGRPVFTELHRFRSASTERTAHLQAVVAGSHKLVYNRLSGSAQLFDLAADPAERDDLATRAPERFAELGALLDAFYGAAAAAHPLP